MCNAAVAMYSKRQIICQHVIVYGTIIGALKSEYQHSVQVEYQIQKKG